MTATSKKTNVARFVLKVIAFKNCTRYVHYLSTTRHLDWTSMPPEFKHWKTRQSAARFARAAGLTVWEVVNFDDISKVRSRRDVDVRWGYIITFETTSKLSSVQDFQTVVIADTKERSIAVARRRLIETKGRTLVADNYNVDEPVVELIDILTEESR